MSDSTPIPANRFPTPLAAVIEQHAGDPKEVAFMLREAVDFIRVNSRADADSEKQRALEDDLTELATAFHKC